jgi:hypothetical protein
MSNYFNRFRIDNITYLSRGGCRVADMSTTGILPVPVSLALGADIFRDEDIIDCTALSFTGRLGTHCQE